LPALLSPPLYMLVHIYGTGASVMARGGSDEAWPRFETREVLRIRKEMAREFSEGRYSFRYLWSEVAGYVYNFTSHTNIIQALDRLENVY